MTVTSIRHPDTKLQYTLAVLSDVVNSFLAVFKACAVVTSDY